MSLVAEQAAPQQPGGRAPRLTPADVEALRNDRSASSRAAVAVKFGAQFDELAEGNEGGLVEAVLWLLVRDVERTVRRALAETIAASPSLPPGAAERLARDEIEVARPVLEHSPVLRDEVLIEIVRTHAMQYALAVAGRAVLSESVADALADTGQPPVVLRLVGNAGAELSGRTLRRIVRDYEDDRDIQVRLVGRPALPPELVDHLIGQIGERLRWELVASRAITLVEAQAIMAAASGRAAAAWTAAAGAAHQGPPGAPDRAAFGRRHLTGTAGALDPERALGFLRDGEMGSFEGAMAELAGLPIARTRQLLFSADRRHLAALCLRAGFGTPHYAILRMAMDLAERCLSTGGRARPYPKDTLEFVQDQYERLKQQPDLVAELIGS